MPGGTGVNPAVRSLSATSGPSGEDLLAERARHYEAGRPRSSLRLGAQAGPPVDQITCPQARLGSRPFPRKEDGLMHPTGVTSFARPVSPYGACPRRAVPPGKTSWPSGLYTTRLADQGRHSASAPGEVLLSIRYTWPQAHLGSRPLPRKEDGLMHPTGVTSFARPTSRYGACPRRAVPRGRPPGRAGSSLRDGPSEARHSGVFRRDNLPSRASPSPVTPAASARRGAVQSGRRGRHRPRLPHHPACGSAPGGSLQT